MHNTDKFEQLVCPKCKTELKSQQDNFFCQPCDIKFPVMDHDIVPFFNKPASTIAVAYLALYQAANGWQNRASSLTKILKTSKRKKQLLPMLKALADNQIFFKDWMKKIDTLVKPDKLIKVVRQNTNNNYGYNYSYLTRDWSDNKDKNNEFNHMLGAINKALTGHKLGGNACFLGIGTGRFAVELADKFDNIWGIDSSFGQVAQFNTALESSVNFWQINTKNSVDSKDMLKKITATIPDKLKIKASRVNYIWADTLNAPFKDDFFDWILSIYFTDVKPLPKLVAEVKRLLKPGGYFLHFGPLEYHFPKVEHHYAYDEFKQYFIENNFEIVYDSVAIPPSVKFDDKSLKINQQYVEKVLLLRLLTS